jgi:hypothetical protein
MQIYPYMIETAQRQRGEYIKPLMNGTRVVSDAARTVVRAGEWL